jgi:thiol-disulfide isomerase/thioredoxin
MKISYFAHIITRFNECLASVTLLLASFFVTFAYAAEIEKLASPQKLPEISYIDENGRKETLDFSKNRITALHFWATWCTPCVQELPEVDKAQTIYKNQGFQVVAISLDLKKENVESFFAENKIKNLPQFFDNNMQNYQNLKIKGLPSTIFVNENGEEIARVSGALGWESKNTKAFIDKQ